MCVYWVLHPREQVFEMYHNRTEAYGFQNGIPSAKISAKGLPNKVSLGVLTYRLPKQGVDRLF